MTNRIFSLLLLITTFGFGCSTEVAPSNSRDPAAPIEDQLPATIKGLITANAVFDPNELDITISGTTSGGETFDSPDLKTEALEGAVSFEATLPGGIYHLQVSAPDFASTDLFWLQLDCHFFLVTKRNPIGDPFCPIYFSFLDVSTIVK